MRITQILCAAGPVDAVTNQAFACRALFERWGWHGEDYSAVIAPGIQRGALRPLDALGPSNGDVVLLHYSGYARGLEPVIAAHRRSLLLSHNITPARYFWPYEPVEGVRCELGRTQLAELAGEAGALAGVSHYNARELHELTAREADVIPVLFDRRALPAPGGSRHAPPTAPGGSRQGPPTILFVGRMAPHKRQDLVIRAFARYRQAVPGAQLVLVGVPMSSEFAGNLQALADEVAPGAVRFETGISGDQLVEHYRRADAFLCLSEHEGFCVPLLEAFHFGVPVVARDAGAIAEVLGDAGVLVDPTDTLQTIAEVLRIVTEDDELRAELRSRGERRLEAYDYERTAERLRGRLMAVAAS